MCIRDRINSSDNGKTWKNIDISPKIDMNQIYFSGTLGFITSESGKLFISTNSGKNWDLKQLPITENLNSIFISKNGQSWLVGESGVLFYSSDLGSTWNQIYSGSSGDLNAIQFFDDKNGLMVGDNGAIFKYVP